MMIKGFCLIATFLSKSYFNVRATFFGPSVHITALPTDIFQNKLLPYLSCGDLSNLAKTCTRMKSECDNFRIRELDLLIQTIIQKISYKDRSAVERQLFNQNIPRFFPQVSLDTATFLFTHWQNFKNLSQVQAECNHFLKLTQKDWVDTTPTAKIRRPTFDDDYEYVFESNSKSQSIYKEQCDKALQEAQNKVYLSTKDIWACFDKPTRAKINAFIKALSMANVNSDKCPIDSLAILAEKNTLIFEHIKQKSLLISNETQWKDFLIVYYNTGRETTQLDQVFEGSELILDQFLLYDFLKQMIDKSDDEIPLTKVMMRALSITNPIILLQLIKKVMKKISDLEGDLPLLLLTILKASKNLQDHLDRAAVIKQVIESNKGDATVFEEVEEQLKSLPNQLN